MVKKICEDKVDGVDAELKGEKKGNGGGGRGMAEVWGGKQFPC